MTLTSDRGRVRWHHVLEIRCARGAAYHGGAEEAVRRAGEFLADIVAQQLEITHLSGDTVTVAPCCAGRIRLNEQRSRVWGGEEERGWITGNQEGLILTDRQTGWC